MLPHALKEAWCWQGSGSAELTAGHQRHMSIGKAGFWEKVEALNPTEHTL